MKVAIETKLIRYLGRWPSGLATGRMRAWIASCRKDDGYSSAEYEGALYNLRDSGRIACVNGVWYLKDLPTTMKEQANDRQHKRNLRRTAAADSRLAGTIRDSNQREFQTVGGGSESGTATRGK